MERYQNLALQLRPKTFEEFIHNGHIVSILKNMLGNQKIPAGILLSGVRGIGKTTLARLFARAVECKNNGVIKPCNECESCKMSLAGNHPDIIEVSGSTNGNIEDIRRLMDQAMLSPIFGGYKVFIVDEAQGLGKSQSSWDALLKVLEEPPPHVLWIFCTTQRTKIPDTIKSRLVSMELKVIPTDLLDSYILSYLMADIKPKKTKEISLVSKLVARAAKNSIRDALTILEKIIPYCQEKGWTYANALEAVGTFDQSQVQQVLDCIVNQRAGQLWGTISSMLESGVDADVVYNEGLVDTVSNLMAIALETTVDRSDLFIPAFKTIGKPRTLYLSDVILRRSPQYNEATNKKFVLQLVAMELCA
jgi:DNA polymerase III subunit gamma/tau